MLISDSHKFAFYHYPRPAGSAITGALAPLLRNPRPVVLGPHWQLRHHVDNIQHHPVFDCGEPPKGYFKASFVRNPFEIVLSAWNGQRISFEEFVMTKVRQRQVPTAKWSQYHFLTYNGKLLVDFVGRHENLQMDFDKFCYHTRVPKRKIKPLNESKSDKGHYRDHYNRRTAAIVTAMWKDDLRYFGYSY